MKGDFIELLGGTKIRVNQINSLSEPFKMSDGSWYFNVSVGSAMASFAVIGEEKDVKKNHDSISFLIK